ncbi:hypothetical protein BJV40_004193 [Clostridium beijerinckii]|nr:hypothetical protein [Clostridium beijerinckii]
MEFKGKINGLSSSKVLPNTKSVNDGDLILLGYLKKF